MNAMKKQTSRVLELYPMNARFPMHRKSQIPEIRTGLRKQAKLLRSVSDALILFCIFAEVIVWFLADVPAKAVYTPYFAPMVSAVGLIMGFTVLMLSIVIRFAASEVIELMKQLNEEV